MANAWLINTLDRAGREHRHRGIIVGRESSASIDINRAAVLDVDDVIEDMVVEELSQRDPYSLIITLKKLVGCMLLCAPPPPTPPVVCPLVEATVTNGPQPP